MPWRQWTRLECDRVALIPTEFGLDSAHICEEISGVRTAAIQRMAVEGSAILGLNRK